MKSLNKRNSRKIEWPVLKALHDLYQNGKTAAKIQDNDFIKYLLAQSGFIVQKKGNNKVLIALEGFKEYFEGNFKDQYVHYHAFLEQAGISPDARKTFTEEDIRTLMMVYESRNELAGRLSNIEDFSSKVFDYGGSKYLKLRHSVRNAVLKILGITEFPQSAKELQYRLVVDYPNPQAVILCENKSFLKQPWNAKDLMVKLWHVGGNNISMIDEIDEMELRYPLFYSCDWDADGLKIYQRIKDKLQNRGSDIKLLIPALPHHYLPTDSFEHRSKWNFDLPLSGLKAAHFSPAEIKLIRALIQNDQWIEEESNVLKEMYQHNRG